MFYGGVLLDVAVAAVVVGEKKAFRAHQFSGAPAAKEHYGILEAGLVYAVYVFGRKPEALRLHVGNTL